MVSGFRPGFLIMGVTAASLRERGTEAELREALMILVMSGEMVGKQCLTIEEGMGSRKQVDVFMVDTMLVSSVGETGVNLESGWVMGCVEGGDEGGAVRGVVREV